MSMLPKLRNSDLEIFIFVVCDGAQKCLFLSRNPGYFYKGFKNLKIPVWAGFVEKHLIKEGTPKTGFEVGI